MSACTPVSLTGSIVIQGSSPCGPCGGAGSVKTMALSLGCGTGQYPAVVSTDIAMSINSPNAFTDVPLLDQLDAVFLLYAQSAGTLTWRLNAGPAVLSGAAGTFPTGFTGGEVLDLTVDTTPVQVTFDAADQSAQQCAARTNAAAALIGLPAIASVDLASGQLVVSGGATGGEGSVVVTASATATALGLSGSAFGTGEDVTVTGSALLEFGASSPVSKIQVKGIATGLQLLAGGNPA